MQAQISSLTVALKAPMAAAHGEVRDRELLLLRLDDGDGHAGWGEAAPLESYDGISPARCLSALQAHAAAMTELPTGTGGAALLDACRDADDLPQALAAVDMALWDLAGRREQRPVAALLSDDPLARVPVNATITAADRSGAAEQAQRAVEAGFRCLKVKVGIGDDAGRVAAVRAAAGPQVALRLDANGAWEVDEAAAALESLSAAGIELVEEPVHGVEHFRELRARVATRIAIDETSREPGALAAGVADAVCLKVSSSGGISALLARAALVRACGAEPYLASTLDGPLGIAAALHCAAALRVDLPCGLATLDLMEGIEGFALSAQDGAIIVPPGPGLGVDGAALAARG